MNFLKSFAASQAADLERQRRFTSHELTEGITTGQYNAMPENEKLDFDRQLVNLWTAQNCYLDWDYEPSGIAGFTNGDLGT